jgi:hypothetical protein
VRVVDVFLDELDLAALCFEGAAATWRPGYHPGTLLKLYIYGYLNCGSISAARCTYWVPTTSWNSNTRRRDDCSKCARLWRSNDLPAQYAMGV